MRRNISVLVVDDHTLVRKTVEERLKQEQDLEVAAAVASADEAVQYAREQPVDVVLMDIDMPGTSSFAAARSIKSRSPDTSILFLSAFFHDRYIESALQSQASGYLTKDEDPQVIIEAIRLAASGVAYFSPKVQSRIVVEASGVRLGTVGRSRASLLTARELEVLRYIARGLPKKEIARTMHLSVKTIGRHTENLMDKLALHDRVELARFAIREGLAEA